MSSDRRLSELEKRLNAVGVLAHGEKLIVGRYFHTPHPRSYDELIERMLLATPIQGVQVRPANGIIYIAITITRPLKPTEADQLVAVCEAALAAEKLGAL